MLMMYRHSDVKVAKQALILRKEYTYQHFIVFHQNLISQRHVNRRTQSYKIQVVPILMASFLFIMMV